MKSIDQGGVKTPCSVLFDASIATGRADHFARSGRLTIGAPTRGLAILSGLLFSPRLVPVRPTTTVQKGVLVYKRSSPASNARLMPEAERRGRSIKYFARVATLLYRFSRNRREGGKGVMRLGCRALVLQLATVL